MLAICQKYFGAKFFKLTVAACDDLQDSIRTPNAKESNLWKQKWKDNMPRDQSEFIEGDLS